MVCPWAAAFLLVLLAAPLVFRAPSGPAAREIATREPAARSGRSRSPPVPSGPSGALHTGRDWHAGVCLGALSRSLPVPSGPSGALHTCGAWSLCVPVGGDPPVSRPRRELRSARRLVVRPGPAPAHGHRSQAHGSSGTLHTCGAWSLCVPVGGDPPVSRPRRELRSARRLEAWPGPRPTAPRRDPLPTGVVSSPRLPHC